MQSLCRTTNQHYQLARLEQFSFFPHLHQKEINSQNFWARVSVFFFPPTSFPCRQFGSCTLRHKSKTQLKGERHKEMTPARKRLVLGRALAGRKINGREHFHTRKWHNGRERRREWRCVLFFFFVFLFFLYIYKLKNDAFVLPRERKSKDEERERKRETERKKKTVFWTSFEKSKFFGEVELCG